MLAELVLGGARLRSRLHSPADALRVVGSAGTHNTQWHNALNTKMPQGSVSVAVADLNELACNDAARDVNPFGEGVGIEETLDFCRRRAEEAARPLRAALRDRERWTSAAR